MAKQLKFTVNCVSRKCSVFEMLSIHEYIFKREPKPNFCHLLRKISWLYRFQSPKIKQKHLIPHNKYRSTAGSCLQDQLIHDYQRNLTSLWLRKKFVCVLISSFNKFIGVWLEVKGWFVPSKKLFVYGLVLH